MKLYDAGFSLLLIVVAVFIAAHVAVQYIDDLCEQKKSPTKKVELRDSNMKALD